MLSKALKLRPKPLTIADPRKEVTLVFMVITAVFVAFSALNVFLHPVFMPKFHKLQPFSVDVTDVLRIALAHAIVLLPVVMAMKRTGQNLGSIGISGKDRGRMLALGFVLSAIYIAVWGFLAPSLGGVFTGFSLSLAYVLIFHVIVGFSQEIVWRGYIQTRLIAYGGTPKGSVATSLLFALIHFPKFYYQFSGVALEALTFSLLEFPLGLLPGYIMLRSQNITPSSIFLLFLHWSQLLWQIPLF